jgi:hypothetical protein
MHADSVRLSEKTVQFGSTAKGLVTRAISCAILCGICAFYVDLNHALNCGCIGSWAAKRTPLRSIAFDVSIQALNRMVQRTIIRKWTQPFSGH